MAEVIVAFDVPTDSEAFRLADTLPDLRWAKIGPTLFLRHGAGVIEEFRKRGIKIFLDLKWHDIPNTVAGAVRAARELCVDLASIHALGGAEMLAAAAAASGPVRLAAVSVLTSHTSVSYGEAVGRSDVDVRTEVARLVRLAAANAIDAFVTSPREVDAMRASVAPEAWLVVPGIRMAGGDPGDQKRVADSRTAVRAGATHLVVGRPIIGADRPDVVYNQICEEIA